MDQDKYNREQVEALARLFANRDFKILTNWIEGQIQYGFEQLLRKKSEETFKEKKGEIVALRRVLSHVKSAWEQNNRPQG